MIIVYGFALLSASVLLIAYVAKVKNSPSAPKWTTYNAITYTVLFSSVTGFTFGIAFIVEAAADISNVKFGLVEAVLFSLAFGATYFAVRKIRAKGRTPVSAKWHAAPSPATEKDEQRSAGSS